ncbi:MBL-fold metallo-hydrolase superfamily [Olavius sp. associated proteobacterium Delta 1]|nr:MBL-fold metallo-hydrolase superfamily [Olavius sp. associated proteobacterium Delta 1]
MELQSYRAEELFEWVTGAGHDFTLLDVRNNEEFGRFKVEGPQLSKMINVPYIEFIELEQESVAKVQVPKDESIRIVCAKEGSAKFVGEILANNGWTDVRYLEGGIKTWGNMLAPKLIASQNGYKLYQFIRPGKASCSYGLIYENKMVVFDPSRNIDFYQSFASENGSKLIKTFETHLQADYISGSRLISSNTGAQIIGHENDFQGAAFVYEAVSDGEVFSFSNGGPEIKAIHMPGHTPGSTSYLLDNQYLVSGDMIFILSIGRPDLGGKAEEWAKLLYNTLKTKIAELNDNIIILPGHYIEWSEANSEQLFIDTLGSIKQKNSDIYGIQEETEFVNFIKKNMRKQPDEYAEIRKVNAGLLDVDDEDQEIMDLGKNECAASMYAPN